jgi:hypothetical protein
MGYGAQAYPVVGAKEALTVQRQEIVLVDDLRSRFGDLPAGPWSDRSQAGIDQQEHSGTESRGWS